MYIKLGETAGFCFGIKNAVENALKLIKEENKKIYCLGELTHNKQVMNKIKEKGIQVVEKIDEIEEGSTVIFRAHGVPPEVYEKAKLKNLTIKDLTCPKVLKIHEQANEYKEQGYYTFLIAEKNHPETIGTFGFCGENACIIDGTNEVKKARDRFKQSKCKKAIVIAQTTYSLIKFDEIVKELQKNVENLEINKTICNATNLRQTETEKLAKAVELMIIIGGKNSSNTNKLYEISKNNAKKAIFIETKDELNVEEIKQYYKIGVMAGASTPKESIEDVINLLKEL